MADFRSTRRVVVQLLKDWADQFGSTTLRSERGGNTDGHWLLTGELLNRATKNTDVYRSKRILAEELRWMREHSPYYTYLKRVFLTSDTAHSAYAEIQKRAALDAAGVWDGIKKLKRNFADLHHDDGGHLARTLVTYWETNASEEMKVEHAIDLLTRRCIEKGHELYCDYPAAYVDLPPPTRKQTKEESYAEINRVFEHWCETIQAEDPQAKRYRNKAINNTATTLSVSVRTVKRAINAEQEGDAA